MISIHFATAEDLREFYGSVEKTVRAIVLRNGSRIVGCAGLYLQEGGLVMFSDIGEEVRKAPKVVLKGAKLLLQMAARTGLPVHATPDEGVEASVRFLEHMGFRHLARGVYQWRA